MEPASSSQFLCVACCLRIAGFHGSASCSGTKAEADLGVVGVIGEGREAALVRALLRRRAVDVLDLADRPMIVPAVDVVIDARHPYAPARPPTDHPQLRLLRAPWTPSLEDRWNEAPDLPTLLARLNGFERVFVTLGQRYVASFAAAKGPRFFFRRIASPASADAMPAAEAHAGVEIVYGQGPFTVAAECALFERLGVDALATRNDGARGAAPKIHAARALGLPVFFLSRPPAPALFTSSPRAAARWAVNCLSRVAAQNVAGDLGDMAERD